MQPGKLNLVKPTTSDHTEQVEPTVLPSATEKGPTKEFRKAGKEDYKFMKSYRKANLCQKFFYTYGNPVVKSVNDNNGTLKMENIEDIKGTEEETVKMVQKFTSHIRKKVTD